MKQRLGAETGGGKSALRWGIERRLEFIDFRLFWEGRINRADLTRYFGISTPQASADLSRYQELAPDNIVYDKSAKCYLATPAFDPVYEVQDSNRYLAQLRSIADGTLKAGEVWIAELPGFQVVPTPGRTIAPQTLKAVLDAIRNRQALKVHYQSMSTPEARWRWITPHALGFDGFRWHARAFCHEREAFRDFVFARILKVGETRPHEIDPETDLEWTETIAVVIAPHPGLSEQQKAAIALDYGMADGECTIEVRRAFLYYLLKRLGLDDAPRRRRPEDQHIVLVNRKAIRQALSWESGIE